jgi:hypothetical protein
MNIKLTCSCGNTDTLLSGQVSAEDRIYKRLTSKTKKPIYLWGEVSGKIMVKCLACNKESEL